MFQYCYFFEELKIVERNLHKLNCSYGSVSLTLNINFFMYIKDLYKYKCKYTHIYISIFYYSLSLFLLTNFNTVRNS